MSTPPPGDPLPDRRLDPDRQEEEQEQRQILRLLQRHPRVALGLVVVLALSLLALGAFFGRDIVVGMARAALTVSGLPVPARPGEDVTDAHDAGAGQAARSSELKAAIRDELALQLALSAAQQKDWTRDQMAQMEARINARIDGALQLARLTRNNSRNTGAAVAAAGSN